MTENEVFKKYVQPWFVRKRKAFVFKVDHSRLPDVYTCNVKGVRWAEIKVVKHRSKDGEIKPSWRPGQLAWIREQERFAGHNNVSLVVYLEYNHQCRLYPNIKGTYIDHPLTDQFELIGDINGPIC